MSQPASPIGSVEFIVKFDSMQTTFVDALKEAMKDIDIEGVGDVDPKLESKIDEIVNNLRNRLRTPWTGDRLQFLETAKPELETIRSEDSIRKVADMIENKKILEKEEGEDPNKFRGRTERMAKDLLENWALMLEKAIKDPQYWEKNKRRILTYQGAFQSGLGLGLWERLSRDMFKQIIKEHKIEEIFLKWAEKRKVKTVSQKVLSKVPLEIDITEEGSEGKKIEDLKDLSVALAQRGVSGEEFEKLLKRRPMTYKGVSEKITTVINDLLKEFIIPQDTKIANIIQRIWRDYLIKEEEITEEEYPIKREGAIIPDLNIIIENTKESIDNFVDLMKDVGMTDIKIQEFLEEAKQSFGDLEKLGEEIQEQEEGEEKEISLEEIKQEFILLTRDFKTIAFQAVRDDLLARYAKGTEIFDIGQIPKTLEVLKEDLLGEELDPEIREQKSDVIIGMFRSIIELMGSGQQELITEWKTALQQAEDAGTDISDVFKLE